MQRPVTLITGASSGVGRAIAVRLAPERILLLNGRDRERLEETARQCTNGPHLIWTQDLCDLKNILNSLVDCLAKHQISVNCFIHSAGMVTVMPARSIGYVNAQRILDVNCVSALEIVSTLLKKRVNHHALTNALFISSIWSRTGSRGHTLYCASKAALDGAMRALAVELAPTVRVNSLLLGAVNTPMAANALENPIVAAAVRRDYPLGLGSPEAVADVAAFIVSEQARWITGQEIVVDGGRSIDTSHK